ncbi:MAG: phosphoribosyl-ATP diphosphatase [Spirochaetaceae bacterium]|nr:phosphoribosyl-ATP diphosphatase [Spirochaetaceae bacterium]
MIIPSIDILDGRAVQLRGGRHPMIDVGNPEEVAQKLSRIGEIAVVDLNAALGKGSNKEIILRLLARYACRVGGGIRSKELALEYLNAGARSVVIGTKATPDFLSSLPAGRVIAALDVERDVIMVEGWTRRTGDTLSEKIAELSPFVKGFLITTIEEEGEMSGFEMEKAKNLIVAAKGRRITFAGGLPGGAAGMEQIAWLDAAGADVQAGTAIATGALGLAQAFAAPLVSDRADGLWPTAVCDEGGRFLGLVYSDLESLEAAFQTGKGVYKSRSRGLWTKGACSGNTQRLIRADLDCDRDCIRFTVVQEGRGFCHLQRRNCFDDGYGMEKLSRTIARRMKEAPEGSYTKRLFSDPGLLAAKLREEADELAKASGKAETVAEAADVFYFGLVKALTEGGNLSAIEGELERRSFKVSRRPGNAKPGYDSARGEAGWAGIH